MIAISIATQITARTMNTYNIILLTLLFLVLFTLIIGVTIFFESSDCVFIFCTKGGGVTVSFLNGGGVIIKSDFNSSILPAFDHSDSPSYQTGVLLRFLEQVTHQKLYGPSCFAPSL